MKKKANKGSHTRIVVVVSGGVVQSVLSSDSKAEVELIDYDNAEDEGTTEQAEEEEEKHRETLTEVFCLKMRQGQGWKE